MHVGMSNQGRDQLKLATVLLHTATFVTLIDLPAKHDPHHFAGFILPAVMMQSQQFCR